jgi:hypothetical protein
MVVFQLTGSGVYGIDRVTLEQEHGIRLDELNRVFVEQVNASSHCQLLLGSWVKLRNQPQDEGSARRIADSHASTACAYCVCFDVSGKTCMRAIWDGFSSVADEVLGFHFKGVKNCKCGF